MLFLVFLLSQYNGLFFLSFFICTSSSILGLPWWLRPGKAWSEADSHIEADSGKESACNIEDPGLIPGWGRSPGEWIGNPLQYSFLENSMDRGAWWATVHGFAKRWT